MGRGLHGLRALPVGLQILHHDHEFAPNVDKLVLGGEPPVKPDADGRYPQPMPGVKTKREY